MSSLDVRVSVSVLIRDFRSDKDISGLDDDPSTLWVGYKSLGLLPSINLDSADPEASDDVDVDGSHTLFRSLRMEYPSLLEYGY